MQKHATNYELRLGANLRSKCRVYSEQSRNCLYLRELTLYGGDRQKYIKVICQAVTGRMIHVGFWERNIPGGTASAKAQR